MMAETMRKDSDSGRKTDSDESHRNARSDIIAISLVTAFCLVGDSFLYIALPLYWQEAGLHSIFEVGVILAVNRLVRLPLNPLLTRCYNKISPKHGIFLATFLAIFSTAGYGLFTGLASWLFLRVVWGIAWTFLRLGTLYSILNVGTSANKGYLTGLNNGIYRLGSLVGMLGGGVLADLFGLKTAALCFAAVSCAAPFVAWFGISNQTSVRRHEPELQPAPAQKERFFLSLWHFLHGQRAWILWMGFAVAFAYQGLVASSLSALVKAHLGETFLFLGGLFSCASVSGFFQALRWGWEPFLAPKIGCLSDGPRGRMTLVRSAFIVAGITLFCAALHKPVVLELLSILLVLAGATLLTTASDSLANDMAAVTESPRMTLSLYAFFGDFGAAVGPLVAYGIIKYFSVNVAWMVTGLFLILFCLRHFVSKTPHTSC